MSNDNEPVNPDDLIVEGMTIGHHSDPNSVIDNPTVGQAKAHVIESLDAIVGDLNQAKHLLAEHGDWHRVEDVIKEAFQFIGTALGPAVSEITALVCERTHPHVEASSPQEALLNALRQALVDAAAEVDEPAMPVNLPEDMAGTLNLLKMFGVTDQD